MGEIEKQRKVFRLERELKAKESFYDDTKIKKTLVDGEIDRLNQALADLNKAILSFSDYQKKVKNSAEEIPRDHFKGDRRTRVEQKVTELSGGLRGESSIHLQNYGLIQKNVNDLVRSQGGLEKSLATAWDRINSIKAELKSL